HEDVSPRGHAHRDVQRLNVHLRCYRDVGLHGAFPIPREGFHGVEGSLRFGLRRWSLGLVHLVRVGLRKGHGGKRHQSNGQHKSNGFHVSFSSKKFVSLVHSLAINQLQRTPSSYTVIANYNTMSDVKWFLTLPARR